MNDEAAAKLRAAFPASAVGKLPRVTDKGGQKSKCSVCNGYLPRHIHLDYVGHAAVTDRLLQVDPEWTWEPVAFGEDGLPAIHFTGGEAKLWIKLTICGTTRFGVGIASGVELEKQLISDAIRNAAMRFGVALDLWGKEDFSHDDSAGEAPPAPPPDPAGVDFAAVQEAVALPPVGNLLVDAMTAKELHDELERLGLPSSGTKAEMRERLVAA